MIVCWDGFDFGVSDDVEVGVSVMYGLEEIWVRGVVDVNCFVFGSDDV